MQLKKEVYDDTTAAAWSASAVSPYCAVTIVTRAEVNMRSIVNAKELAAAATARGCQVQTISMEKLTMKAQIGEVRWNTTLYVSVDGSALFNALFMHECSTVMYVETWRREMMFPQLEPAVWRGYTPLAADTSFTDPHNPIVQHLQSLIANYTAQGRAAELETMSLDPLPFPNDMIENVLRNRQSVHVQMAAFEGILEDSIRHNRRCRRVSISVKEGMGKSRGSATCMAFRMLAG